MAKSRTFESGTASSLTAKRVLVYVLSGILKLLHPYMPFITEEIYQAIPHADESIMISAYPAYDESLDFADAEEAIDRMIGCIVAIRARRAEMNVPPSKKAKLFVVTKYEDNFRQCEKIIEKLAYTSELIITDKYESDDAIMIATDSGSLYIPLSEVVDLDKERARLAEQMKKNDMEIERIEKKLSNEGFVSKAPAQVIEGEKIKREKALERLEKIKESLAALG